MNTLAYALVTSAKNEEGYIEKTIQSVISQTIRPIRWIIVDDGSSDHTTEIANAYANRHPWMVVVRNFGVISRDFASKARSFAVGCEQTQGCPLGLSWES